MKKRRRTSKNATCWTRYLFDSPLGVRRKEYSFRTCVKDEKQPENRAGKSVVFTNNFIYPQISVIIMIYDFPPTQFVNKYW